MMAFLNTINLYRNFQTVKLNINFLLSCVKIKFSTSELLDRFYVSNVYFCVLQP